jgi:alkyldihydroxyacetonephosphate synthase
MTEGIDKTSMLLTCPVDERLAVLERRLNREGLTLGYRPPQAGRLTLRQALERRIPNRDALLYGGIDDLCVSLQALRKGETIATRNVPRAATGPDFKKILIGSGRRYAKLVKAVLRVHPLPEAREVVRLAWKEKKNRDAFLKSLWGSGIRPVRLRTGPRAVTVALEGAKEMVAAEKRCLRRLARPTKGKIT